MRGNMQDAVGVGAQALFMPHGLGHQMGLDVHDMENIGEKYVGYDEETLRRLDAGAFVAQNGQTAERRLRHHGRAGHLLYSGADRQMGTEGLGGGFIDFEKVREYLDFGGIRIEDDMLITYYGNRMLGGNRPR